MTLCRKVSAQSPDPLGHDKSDEAESLRRQLKQFPWLSQPGKLFAGVHVDAGLTAEITHGLGRQPTGYIMLDHFGDPHVGRQAWSKETITFDNSGSKDAVIAFWLY